MPQDLIEITQGECGECVGGISDVAAIDCGYVDIDAVTIDANRRITSVPFTTPDKVVELRFDDDDTARHDSVGERNGNIHRNNQETFMKFGCMDNDKILAADEMKRACCLVLAIRYNDGMEVIQGIDAVADGVNWKARFSKTKAKATVSALSGTGAEEDRIEITVASVSRNLLVPMVPATYGYDDFIA